VCTDGAHSSGQFAIEAEALHHAARFGDGGVAIRLAGLAETVDGGVVDIQSRHAAALASESGDALDAAGRDFQTIGFMLSAADSFAQAAIMHRRALQLERERLSAARSQELADLCGGVTTPALNSAHR
jgi:hypothetical protein